MPDNAKVLDPRQVTRSFLAGISALNAMLLFPWFLCGVLGFMPMILGGTVDFRNLYTAGYMVRSGHGHEIYDPSAQKQFQNQLVSYVDIPLPFIRPAYQALLFVPFSFLPFRLAFCVFYAFNLAVLLLCFRLLRPYMVSLGRVASYLPAVMFLFLPINVALASGQDSIVLLTLLAGALACIERDREVLAGILVALGLFKFQLVIPIAVLFLVWRRWRFSAAFACTAAMLAGISTWIVGAAQALHYIQAMIQLGHSFGFGPRFPLPIGKMPNLHGALHGILGESPLVLPLTVAASAVAMTFFATRRTRGGNALIVAIPASALVSYYLVAYDMSMLAIPLVVMLSRLADSMKAVSMCWRLQLMASIFLFAFPVLVLLSNLQFWTVSIPLLAFSLAVSICPPLGLPSERNHQSPSEALGKSS
jgi:hypothetical protein